MNTFGSSLRSNVDNDNSKNCKYTNSTVHVEQTYIIIYHNNEAPKDFAAKNAICCQSKIQISSKILSKNPGFCHFLPSEYDDDKRTFTATFSLNFHIIYFSVCCQESGVIVSFVTDIFVRNKQSIPVPSTFKICLLIY